MHQVQREESHIKLSRNFYTCTSLNLIRNIREHQRSTTAIMLVPIFGLLFEPLARRPLVAMLISVKGFPCLISRQAKGGYLLLLCHLAAKARSVWAGKFQSCSKAHTTHTRVWIEEMCKLHTSFLIKMRTNSRINIKES